MDLEPGWERKALIAIGVIFVVVVIYAYNPFAGPSNANAQNQSDYINTSVETTAPPAVASNNSTENITANMTGNNTFQISADVAKNIALGANPGFTVGEPSQENITINNTRFSVWNIPLMKNNIVTKKVYVDLSTGMIVGYA